MPRSLSNLWSRLVVCVVSAAILLTLPACMSGREPYRPVQLARDEAVIYIYRPRSLLSPGPVGVVVDQVEVGSLGRNTYLAVIVSPGEHLVRVQRRSGATRLLRIGPDQSLFYEAGASLLGGRVSLSNPGEAIARERIARTRAARETVQLKVARLFEP